MPEEQILHLSDAFEGGKRTADLELTVWMLNINYGHNRELMEKCKILEEYASFVKISRDYMADGTGAETALERAIDHCIADGILTELR